MESVVKNITAPIFMADPPAMVFADLS